MSVLVYGAGGIGLYLAARLARAGEPVTVKARPATVRAAASGAVELRHEGGAEVVPGIEFVDDLAGRRFDVAVVATKSWQVETAAAEIAPALAPGGRVLTTQNGVDAPARVAAHVPSDAVYGGTVVVIVQRVAPLAVRLVGSEARLVLGSLRHPEPDPAALRLVGTLQGAGVDARWTEDIRTALWRKLALIASYGGVGALADAPVGRTRSLRPTRDLVERAMREVLAVGNRSGARLGEDDLAEILGVYEHGFAPETTASLQRDLREGRPSELADQSGAVVRHAAALGIPVPVHELIWATQLPRELAAREGRADLGPGPVVEP
ncbi:ketopantoate reductase family protein [Actinoalloteichus spitiensis]|uniref:ketopantoate reductase family protein n=1 Tax=Actinoalloteichus spitiensis TaxID=252394 RepID=UPI0003766122|nr:2-dehydropantoate 2-reductase [Actinoalloteichus spitiensis]